VPKIRGFPLTLIVALTTVLRTNMLHCDNLLSNDTAAVYYIILESAVALFMSDSSLALLLLLMMIMTKQTALFCSFYVWF